MKCFTGLLAGTALVVGTAVQGGNGRVIRLSGGWTEHPLTVQEKIERIVIPEVAIEDEPLGDVIAMIRYYARRYDPEEKGINVLFSGTPAQASRRVTILASALPLADMIRYLCLDNGLTFRIDRAALVFTTRGNASDFMETRCYPVSAGSHFTVDDEKAGRGAKVFFEEKGVSFPPGAEAIFVRRVGRLVAHNTQENLRRTEQILLELGIWEPDGWKPTYW